jgi:hypothetical protein
VEHYHLETTNPERTRIRKQNEKIPRNEEFSLRKRKPT